MSRLSDHTSPLELLVATIVAAQCTDERVNIVSKELFKKYRTPADWVKVPREELEQDIRSTGFYRNKAASIQKTCQLLIDKFGGNVPQTMDELLTLNGVGRKTADVILGNCFGVQGIVCDTHVIRLSRRLGLSANSDPVKLELSIGSSGRLATPVSAGQANTRSTAPASEVNPGGRNFPATYPQTGAKARKNGSLRRPEKICHLNRPEKSRKPS